MNVTSRDDLQMQFVLKFADLRRRIEPVVQADLDKLAGTLGTTLPEAYAKFLLRHGAVYCPAILKLTTRCGLDHPDLRHFLAPREIIAACQQHAAELMPEHLFVFAADCLGNLFCFRKSTEVQEDAPVYFRSREADDFVELDESFDALLRWYVVQEQAMAPDNHASTH